MFLDVSLTREMDFYFFLTVAFDIDISAFNLAIVIYKLAYISLNNTACYFLYKYIYC